MQATGPAYIQTTFSSVGPTSPSAGAAIEFQEIPHQTGSKDIYDNSALLRQDQAALHSAINIPLPASPLEHDGGAGEGYPSNAPAASFYQLSYYQGYFDVSTEQISRRLLRALFPFGQKMYPEDDPRPDLYAPFWIATTLVFLLAAAGNFANYIQFINDNTEGDPTKDPASQDPSTTPVRWNYSFQKVTFGATLFYGWISLLPLALYCFFARVGRDAGAPQKSFPEIASLFGYALAIYLPVCILCIPPVAILRWVAVGVAFGTSSYLLIRNLGADVSNKALVPGIAATIILNLGVALVTKFYFFDF